MTDYTDLKERLGMVQSDLQGRVDATKLQMISEALAAIEELEARNQWQPIETAPHDTEILVFMDEEIYEARLDTYGGKIKGWTFPMADYHGCGCCSGSNDLPTHWMPLPQPPEQGQ